MQNNEAHSSEAQDGTRSLALLSGLGLLAAIPILAPGRPMIDDLGRAMQGNADWGVAGRPLADIVMWSLNVGPPLTDLSPLPQMLALAAMVYCCWLTSNMMRIYGLHWIPAGLSSSLLLFNPFLIENLSYRFDALTMTLSFVCATLAATQRLKRTSADILVGAALLFAACSLYQIGLNVFIGLALIFFILRLHAGQGAAASVSLLMRDAVKFVAGYAAYALIIPTLLLAGGYSETHAQVLPLDLGGLSRMGENAVRGIESFITGFSSRQRILLAIPLALSVLFSIALALRVARREEPAVWRFLACLIVLFTPAIMMLVPFGICTVLSHPVLVPRVFMAFGCTMAFASALSALFAALFFRNAGAALSRYGTAAVAAIPLLLFVPMFFASGVAQRAQGEADHDLAQEIGNRLHDLGVRSGKAIVFDGVQPMAPRAQRQAAKYPLIGALVPRYMNNDWYWGTALMTYEGFPFEPLDKKTRAGAILEASTVQPALTGREFEIIKLPFLAVVRFRDRPR